uniref:Uncharacterized protein n=1 Tax=Helianthus annuus TaxID=4232 RepID=A0A251U6I7_HELAN
MRSWMVKDDGVDENALTSLSSLCNTYKSQKTGQKSYTLLYPTFPFLFMFFFVPSALCLFRSMFSWI